VTSSSSTVSVGASPARPTAEDAFRAARRIWFGGGRVDMSALAVQLGIGRVTLYRWVGGREKLLVEVVWDIADRWLRAVDAKVDATGGERIVRIVVDFLDGIIRSPAMRIWLRDEGEYAMRLLTRTSTNFQPRLIAAVHELLEQEAATGALDIPVDLHELAYVIVRMIESYTYLDLITGEEPDAQRAEPVLRMLLGVSSR
jgi:AcrR family transcriptional regulator